MSGEGKVDAMVGEERAAGEELFWRFATPRVLRSRREESESEVRRSQREVCCPLGRRCVFLWLKLKVLDRADFSSYEYVHDSRHKKWQPNDAHFGANRPRRSNTLSTARSTMSSNAPPASPPPSSTFLTTLSTPLPTTSHSTFRLSPTFFSATTVLV